MTITAHGPLYALRVFFQCTCVCARAPACTRHGLHRPPVLTSPPDFSRLTCDPRQPAGHPGATPAGAPCGPRAASGLVTWTLPLAPPPCEPPGGRPGTAVPSRAIGPSHLLLQACLRGSSALGIKAKSPTPPRPPPQPLPTLGLCSPGPGSCSNSANYVASTAWAPCTRLLGFESRLGHFSTM